MFFIKYLGRELRRRMRQAIFIALGLAVGIGLVITVMGASDGVKKAQSKVLSALYGIGTDLTVTTKPKPPPHSNSGPSSGQTFQIGGGPGNGPGGQSCVNGKCTPLKSGDVIDNLVDPSHGPIQAADLARLAALKHVKSVTGGLLLNDNRIVIPTSSGGPMPQPVSTNVDGVDPGSKVAGPLSNAVLSKGRALSKTDTYAALVDANYATAHGLHLGGKITLAGKAFTIVGLLTQPQASTPPDAYIPLATAQKLASDPGTGKNLNGVINTAYITADSAANIPVVQKEIQQLMSDATVTSSASLASQVTGSLASTAKLANELGKWLSVLVLIAAFAVACLLTLAAVSRRIPEFGTLKALGWRGRRIVSQVLGESVGTGIIGGLAGIGLGVAGVAIIGKVAPKLTATVASASGNGGFQTQMSGPPGGPAGGGPGTGTFGGPAAQAQAHSTISVPMSASVTATAILLAVVLALAGGLLAGSFGGWRAARLRPAAAFRKVA